MLGWLRDVISNVFMQLLRYCFIQSERGDVPSIQRDGSAVDIRTRARRGENHGALDVFRLTGTTERDVRLASARVI